MSPRRTMAIVVAGGLTVAAVGAAAWVYGGRSVGQTDIGALEGLRQVQTKLRPLDACVLDFNSRDIGVGQHHDAVHVTPCTPEKLGSAIRFEVGTTWKRAHPSIKFLATRSSTNEPWRIEVDTSRATFQEMQAALEELAPSLVVAYPGLLAAYRAQYADAPAKLDRAAAEREGARARAKNSYPTK